MIPRRDEARVGHGAQRRVASPEIEGRCHQRRDVDILSTGCQWRALPKDLPPRSTVHDYLGAPSTFAR